MPRRSPLVGIGHFGIGADREVFREDHFMEAEALSNLLIGCTSELLLIGHDLESPGTDEACLFLCGSNRRCSGLGFLSCSFVNHIFEEIDSRPIFPLAVGAVKGSQLAVLEVGLKPQETPVTMLMGAAAGPMCQRG